MKEINTNNWERYNTYTWFKGFSNSTYGVNVLLDVTKLVKHSKENNQSFFINALYIILKGLNSVDEMRMRLIDDKPYIFDDINPAFTVMTKAGTFENVRFDNTDNYKDFYRIAKELIEEYFVENTDNILVSCEIELINSDEVDKDIIDTLDGVIKIHEEGRIKRAQAEEELQSIEQELKDKVLEINVKE